MTPDGLLPYVRHRLHLARKLWSNSDARLESSPALIVNRTYLGQSEDHFERDRERGREKGTERERERLGKQRARSHDKEKG